MKHALTLLLLFSLFACTTPNKQQAMQDAKRTLEEEKAKDDPCYEHKGTPDYDRCQTREYRRSQQEALKKQQQELLKESRDSMNDTLNKNTKDLGL